MFTDKSRYKDVPTYTVRDNRGRVVEVVSVPDHPGQPLFGIHVLKQGERLDHLAARYTNDSAGFWRIAERNDAMTPEQIAEKPEIEIPVKR